MKRFSRWPLVLVAISMLIAAPISAPLAQLNRPPIIGVIDIQAVLRASAAVQSLSRQVESQRQAALETVRIREAALRAADIDLAQRRASLSAEDYAEERSKLEAEGMELQRQAEQERRSLDQLFSRGMSQVQQVLVQISQDIARENNLDLMLAKTAVIIVRPEFDFTEEALKRLNAQLADVALPLQPN